MKRILFIDRDGTLIEEPADEQIDSFEKLKFVDGVFRNLSFIREKLDFEFVPSGPSTISSFRHLPERESPSTTF